MEKINLKNILLQWPFRYDMNLMKEKGLADNIGGNEKFIKITNNYKVLFEKFLLTKTSLRTFDNNLVNSKLSFVPIKDEDKDYYQRTSTLNFKYFYLRNNLNIEKLSVEELNYLESLDYDTLELDDKNISLIEKTFKSVINPTNIEDVESKTILCYGPDIERFSVNVCDLVFGVRFDEYDPVGLSGDEWIHNSCEQMKYLLENMKNLEETLSKELGVEVKTIQYNEFNIHDNYSYYEINDNVKQR